MNGAETLNFQFTSKILFDPTVADGYMKHYVPIPEAVGKRLEAAQVTHVEGKLNGVAFRRTLHLRADGSLCLKFGKTWLEQANLNVDEEVTLQLAPDPDPDRIDLPEELTSELMREPDLARLFFALSPSMQKTLAYGIERAKQPETRLRRARSTLQKLLQTEKTDEELE